MTEQENEVVNCCIDNINMERVHKTMTYLEWKWNDHVPDMFEIRQFARKLFKDAIERGDKHIERYDTSCGGFHVVIYRENEVVVFVELSFVLATSEWDVEWESK